MNISQKLQSKLPCFLLTASILLIACSGCGSRGSKMDIVERFDGDSFDRVRWEIPQPDPAVGTVEIRDESVLFTIPPSPEPRPQIRSNGKFWFDGDFEVQMSFQLLDPLPEPEKDYINVELMVFGADGAAHFSRTNHKGAGNGVVSYFNPKVEHLSSHWNHTASDADSGTLKIRRTGESIEYVYDVDGNSSVVGESDFGTGPVSGVALAISVSTPTQKSFRVRIDDIEVHSTPREVSVFKGNIGKWAVVGVVILLTLLGVWLYQSGDDKQGNRPNDEQSAASVSQQPASAENLDEIDVS